MADFVPINTQEEFNTAIADRLRREREKYADYDSIKAENGTLKNQVTTLTGEKEALEKQVKGHATAAVKMRIAQELNIPTSMADRLTGETEDDIRKDAESMASIFKAAQGAAPLYNNTNTNTNNENAAMAEMLHNLRGE